MRFTKLEIKNLRAVEHFTVDSLGDFVVVAGQNGCGKSCVFDAIRLLKSLYGGYQPNEHLQWFGEFAINVHDRNGLSRLFRDPSGKMMVSAQLEFTKQESDYLSSNARKLALPLAWQIATGQPFDYYSFSQISVATQFAHLKPRVDQELEVFVAALLEALRQPSQKLSVSVDLDGNLQLERCVPAQIVFQAYEPDHLGVIDYHSASRAYTRQDVSGINLDPRQFQDQRRQQRLYNWQAKYQNVKTELASAYVRRLIASEADGEDAVTGDDLNETLKDLFNTFFPEKEYLGARALSTGNLEFPVRLPSGRTHDIDELSSGEKEILYGYLRLRNSVPKNSIILLDEPELHLNPSLLQGFADFYYRHLGVANGNQIWMVTHSDALLRQAVGNSNYHVFHMTPASPDDSGANQASSIFLDDELERATVDLVGDLASYQPHSKVVIFEGEGTTGFDVSMVRRLFPDFARRINLVSGGNKSGVANLYAVLENSTTQLMALERFYAVVDRDHENSKPEALGPRLYRWDCYHIENYLLDASALRAVVNSAARQPVFGSDFEVLEALKECATHLTGSLVLELLQKEVNETIIGMINVRGNPDTANYVEAIYPSIAASIGRVKDASEHFSIDKLSAMGQKHEARFRSALADGTWVRDFPGRKILKRFVDRYVAGITYEPFVNLILDKLSEDNRQPAGMKTVLDQILTA